MKNDISLQITNIFNLSFSTGVFPSGLKITKMIPSHKKESKLESSNYRPILLLSNLDKILEKLIYYIIYDFLEKYQLIYSLQFGFQQNYSTSYAILSLTESIMKTLDEDNFVYGIFVHLEKTLVTVDHNKSGFQWCVLQNAIYFSIISMPKKSNFATFVIPHFVQNTSVFLFFVFLP